MADADLAGNGMGQVNSAASGAAHIELLERHDFRRAGGDDVGDAGGAGDT
ncbi:hypothetical protein [Microvirga brassicacearum]|nr:hypothetical protein [Microvirga brassicacearum]